MRTVAGTIHDKNSTKKEKTVSDHCLQKTFNEFSNTFRTVDSILSRSGYRKKQFQPSYSRYEYETTVHYRSLSVTNPIESPDGTIRTVRSIST